MHSAPQSAPQPATQPVPTTYPVPKTEAINIIRSFKQHLPQGISADAQGRIKGLNLSTPNTKGQTSIITFSGPNAQILAQAFSNFYQNYLKRSQAPSKKF